MLRFDRRNGLVGRLRGDRRRNGSGVDVETAVLLVALPTGLVTTTLNFAPLSAMAVAGVV